jgi:hydrogenase maturation protease
LRRALAIGYGNTLRSDDAAGVRAAECAASRFQNLDTVTVHELQPELAETISRYEEVFFLDAGVDFHDVHAELIEPGADPRPDGSHSHSPESLLSLCRTLYNHTPERSVLIVIPARNFDFGEQLSPFTRQMVDAAVERVGHFLVS